MEKSISVEERIRKAEQRYYNKLNKDYNITERKLNNNKMNIEKGTTLKLKKNIKKKLMCQMAICLIIYVIFYFINSNDSLLSKDIKNKAKEILNTDINFSQLCSKMKSNIEKYFNNIQTEKENSNDENIENKDNDVQVDDIQSNNENIGGAIEDVDLQTGETEEIEGQENIETENNSSNEQEVKNEVELSQMEQDANFVKENINIIKPIIGTVSSRYGLRNPTTITVPKNHTGIDLSASTGTKIISATDGTVILNSSKGDYGKHLKIQNGDAVFIYAHCNKLYVNEGDIIKQGQEIAEVGSTGNATGPHLHFEIRYQNRLINPELILEF